MKRLGWTLVFVAAPYFAGCGNSGGTADKKTNEAPSQQVASSAPTNPSAGTAKPTVEMTPAAEVVAQFLDSVRRGDESTVASLLTTEAIAELNKLNIEIDPPGSPEAAFEIGKTEYTDEEKDAAYVELAWIEPVEGSAEKKRNEALFVVRKDQVGWRIAGMVIDAGEGKNPRSSISKTCRSTLCQRLLLPTQQQLNHLQRRRTFKHLRCEPQVDRPLVPVSQRQMAQQRQTASRLPTMHQPTRRPWQLPMQAIRHHKSQRHHPVDCDRFDSLPNCRLKV